MVDVYIPGMVGENHVGLKFCNESFDGFDDIEQGDGVHAVVWEITKGQGFHAQDVACLLSCYPAGGELRLLRCEIAKPGGNPISEEGDMDRCALSGQLGDCTAATENFIIGVSSKNENRSIHQFNRLNPP